MTPEDRAKEYQVAYKTLENTLGIDTTSRSAENLRKIESLLTNYLNKDRYKKLLPYKEKIESGITENTLVLSHGSRAWGKINQYGWLLSDLGLEEEKLKEQNNTQKTDRRIWGNHDFVFFYLGFHSLFSNPGLQKKYGRIRLFSSSELFSKGWVSFGDWMEYCNAQRQQFSLGQLGSLDVSFEKPSSILDIDERSKNTRKLYAVKGPRPDPLSLYTPSPLDEFFKGKDIIPALHCFLTILLFTLRPSPIFLKTLGEKLPEYLLGSCLPAIEAKLPRAVSLDQAQGYAAADGQAPVSSTEAMLSHG